MALSAKQQRFVEEYLIDFNATQAAIRAGYSEATAKQQGSRLLTNADISAAVDARRRQFTDEADVTVREIVEGLKAEATNYDEDASHSARVSAWAHLGKYRGMFTERHEVTHKVLVIGDPDELDADV